MPPDQQLALPHLASRIFGVPLAIARPKLDVLLSVLEPKFLGAAVSPAGLNAAGPRGYDNAGGIAVLPVMGTLVQRAAGLQALSGLTSYNHVTAQLHAALDDPDVDGILFHIDSAGGEVAGLFTLVDQITAAAEEKPVWAFVDEHAYSAAYAIASAADQVFLPATASVGSIGIVCMHLDQSRADDKAGLSYSFVTAGAKKADGNSHAPLSAAARADVQAEVDRVYDIFTGAVASNRGLAQSAVKRTEAGTISAPDAVSGGYADGIATLNDCISMMAEQIAAAAIGIGTQAAVRSSSGATMTRQSVTRTAAASRFPEADTLDAVRTVSALLADCKKVELPELAEGVLSGKISVDQAREMLAEAPEIKRLCARAGYTGEASRMVLAGMKAGDASRELLDRIVDADVGEIDGSISPDARVQEATAGSRLVQQAKAMRAAHDAKVGALQAGPAGHMVAGAGPNLAHPLAGAQPGLHAAGESRLVAHARKMRAEHDARQAATA